MPKNGKKKAAEDYLLDDLAEDMLRHLRGDGDRPGIEKLPARLRSEARTLLKIIDALASSLPSSPPLENDPVAVALGLAADAQPSTATTPRI